MEAAGAKSKTRGTVAKAKKKADDKSDTIVLPGDLRANKGFVFLKDKYIPRFRQPYFQGLFESVVPILLMRLVAGFTR